MLSKNDPVNPEFNAVFPDTDPETGEVLMDEDDDDSCIPCYYGWDVPDPETDYLNEDGLS